jgi:hypothetical protein
MVPSTSFFKRTVTVSSKKPPIKSSVIDVGGDPFRALAVAFIDNLNRGTRLSDDSLQKILDSLGTYFPDYKVNQAHLTPMKQMSLLVSSSPKAEMVDCFTYVMRQLTVDVLLANPTEYPESFYGLSATLSKDHLRQQDTPVACSALAALAAMLHVHLILSFKETDKNLRKCQVYSGIGVNTPYFEVNLQVQDNRYFPRVQNKNDFAFIVQQAIKAPQPSVRVCDESLAEVLESINAKDASLWSNYERYRKILMNALADNELTEHDLMNLYVNFLPEESSAPRFAHIERMKKQIIVGDTAESIEKHASILLVRSIAQGLTMGHIPVDELFDQLEGPVPLSQVVGV